MKNRIIDTDVLIIGGGTAGCFAGITLGKKKDLDVLIVEKANIVRSGCLAAGVNAINAYITKGRVPQDYVDYCKKDADGIVREDLLLSMSERLNHVTKVMEDLGLVILKDENGDYVARGNRNIKINGENIKPILADAVKKQDNVTVINHLNITDFIVENNEIKGAYGFDVNDAVFYEINAKAVLVATGGAAGLYRPNNPGFSRHKMWYPPFNTGAGYAMGINAGAEMTTFEMRFIALRCKDTIAPTGTIAQGVPAKQLNSNGEVYENKYGLTTSQRLYGTVTENREGRGPCYLGTKGISREQEEDLYKAYLNMAPSQTLKWLEAAGGPSEENVEIEGTEPYIVGGHTASGYWVDNNRETTIHGLFAAGDVAGGCPQKYVTGALAEGEIAAQAIAERLEGSGKGFVVNEVADSELSANAFAKKSEYERFLNNKQGLVDIEQTEEAMQKIMDQYAGGISTDYQYNEARLELADEKIKFLEQSIDNLAAQDADDLLRIYEIRERLTVCRSVIAHLKARKETRWHSFAENMDYPAKSDDWLKYVNSRKENGEIKIIIRDLPYLEQVDVDDTEEEKGFYMPVQRVCRPNHEFRGFQGQIEAGSVSVGDEIITLPTKEHVHVKSIHVGDKEAQTASIGQPVTIQLDREVDVSRGSVLAAGADLKLATEITATILWMDDDVLTNNKNFFVKLGTRLIPGVVTEIVNTIDVNTGEEKPAALLKKNEIAVCKISLADVIVVDEFNLHKTMGELILIDRVTNMTSACGVVREVNEAADDVKEVDAAFRAELNNQKPVVVETVLSDKINVDFLKKVEKELLLDSKHVYLYVPAEGEDYTNVVTHLVNAGIVVILALSKAADLKIDGAEVLAGWESEVDVTTVDVAEFIKKNA